jgi:hypothetical protein
VIPDIHIPAHDKRAVDWAVQTLREHKPHGITLLGDVIDLEGVSRFSKTLARRASLPKEIKLGREFFTWINKQFPKSRIRLMLGNHEDRLWKYLLRSAPELAELPELQFRNLFGVPKRWEVYRYGEFVKEQGILLMHGKKWGQALLRQNIMLLGCSFVQGHSHRLKVLEHRFAGTGRQVFGAELGCLCNLKQCYAALTDWRHACGLIENKRLKVFTR